MGVRDIRVKFTGDTSGLAEASKDAEGQLGNFKDSVSKAANLAGAAAGGALAVGLHDALDTQQTLANFKASVGDVKWSESAGKAAGELYGNAYGDSLESVTSAVRDVFAQGLLKDNATETQIESLTGRALSLAQTFGQEVGPLAIAAGQMIKTGLAKNADEAFDLLTKGFQNGSNKADDLLDTFNEYGTQFRKLGVDGPEALGLISQGLQGGARDADIVADAVKEFSIRAIDGSKTTADGFKQIGLKAKDMAAQIGKGGDSANAALDLTLDRLRAIKDPVKRAAVATELFGTQAEDLGQALFALDPSEATKKIGNFEGAAAEVDETVGNTASGSLTAMTRQLRQELANALIKVLPYVQQLTQFVKEHKAVVVPLVGALAAFAGVVWAINAAVRAYTAVQAALNVVMAANPAVLITLAVVALIAVIVLIATKTTWFQTLWKNAWGAIKGAISGVFNWIQSNWPLILAIITGPIGLAVLAVVKNFDKIKSAFSAVKNWIGDRIGDVVGFFTGIGGRISRVASGMFDGIKNAFKSAINFIIRGWNSLRFGIPEVDTHIPGIGKVGGGSFGVPQIPLLADGGTALAGMAHIVGERGPELFVPGRTGTVIPNDALGGDVVVELHGDREALEAVVEKVVVRRNRATKLAVQSGSRRAFA